MPNTQGFLKGITQYNQLLITLNDDEANKINEMTKDMKGNSPLSSWTGNDGKIRHTLKVALADKDFRVQKNLNLIIAKVGKNVSLGFEIKQYDFKKEDEQITGWKATLNTPISIKPSVKEELNKLPLDKPELVRQ